MSTVEGEDDESTDNEVEETETGATTDPEAKPLEAHHDDFKATNIPQNVNPMRNSDSKDSKCQSESNAYGSPKAFKPTDPSTLILTPSVEELMSKNRRFLERVPVVLNSKIQGIEDRLKETSRLVEQTLNTLQDIPIFSKLGINDAAKLCDLINQSMTMIPNMK
eukprot:CAMPEP_0114534738 /NCGR_PEP_ID=MMETSP0109-20121206/28010_1 /TAXON_ID=29199 /ORGANISM="Chlorarachnion reptans, Strain CCCM449" /LENGTH=163 /DNA_ID=CAMNT_0001718191 /DNA_START=92 /DNA_END=583 /DNA_ORIENTATION=+